MELSEEQLLLLSIPRSIHVTKVKSIERLDTKNMNKKDKKGKKPLKKKSYIVIWFRETYPNSPVRKTEQEYSGEANEVLVAAQAIITVIPREFYIGSKCNISPSKIFQKVKRAEGSKPAPIALLDGVVNSMQTIRRFFRKSRDYQDAYKMGLHGPAVSAQLKVFKSHRMPPPHECSEDLIKHKPWELKKKSVE